MGITEEICMKNENMITDSSFIFIDDNPVDILIHKIVLERKFKNPSIIHFKNAKEGLKHINETHTTETNNKTVLLLDLDMPLMNGYEFLAHFDALDKKITDQIKIVVVSVSKDEEEIKMLNANPYVYKFIAKPLSEESISAMMNSIN